MLKLSIPWVHPTQKENDPTQPKPGNNQTIARLRKLRQTKGHSPEILVTDTDQSTTKNERTVFDQYVRDPVSRYAINSQRAMDHWNFRAAKDVPVPGVHFQTITAKIEPKTGSKKNQPSSTLTRQEPVQVENTNHGTVTDTNALSDAAKAEVKRLQNVKRDQLARSLGLTQLVDDWYQEQLPSLVDSNTQSKTASHGKNANKTDCTSAALDPNASAETLSWLATQLSHEVRSAVAQNPSTPFHTLWLLARDYQPGVRLAVADSPNTPVEILETLAEDQNPLVSCRAKNALKQPVHSLKDETTYCTGIPITHEAGISISETPSLAELAKSPDVEIRLATAEKANLPIEVLWILARDSEQSVRLKITENNDCPFEILGVLAEDADAVVACEAKAVLHHLLGPDFMPKVLRQPVAK
jgi:hypothetical protein